MLPHQSVTFHPSLMCFHHINYTLAHAFKVILGRGSPALIGDFLIMATSYPYHSLIVYIEQIGILLTYDDTFLKLGNDIE